MKYTNIFGDTEISGFSPDGLGDYYKITDAQRDHNYWQEKIVSALQGMSIAHTTDCQIIYGGDVTDGGSGTVDISAGMALGKDSAGNIRLVTVPALTGVSLPTGWNDDRQIWVIGQFESSLDTPTRTHKLATPDTYHYISEDNYKGNADSDDLFVDSDPNSVADTIVCWGSFRMNGTTFSAETGRTDSMGLSVEGNIFLSYLGYTNIHYTYFGGTDGGAYAVLGHNIKPIASSDGYIEVAKSHATFGYRGIVMNYSTASDGIRFYAYQGTLVTAEDSINPAYERMRIRNDGLVEVYDDFIAQDTKINQYGIGVNGGTATTTIALDVTGNADISGDLSAQDTTINQYGIGVNGATATTTRALKVTGNIETSGVIYNATNPVYGYMDDGTPLYAKIVNVTISDLSTSGSAAHGISNADSNGRILSIVAVCDDGTFNQVGLGWDSASVAPDAIAKLCYFNDTTLWVQREDTELTLIFKCFIVYK